MVNETLLWNAVSNRDAHWDGAFVYAVPFTSGTAVRRVRAAGPGATACRFLRPRRRRARPGSAPAGAAIPTNHRRCRRASTAFAGRVPPSRPTPKCRRPWLTCRGWSAPVRIICFAPSSSCLESHLVRTRDACRVGALKAGLRNGHGVVAATYDAGYGSGSRVYEQSPSVLGPRPPRLTRAAERAQPSATWSLRRRSDDCSLQGRRAASAR